MKKKHFEALADIIKQADKYMNDTARYKIANRIADYCLTQNYSFDVDRFLKACNFKEYQHKCQICQDNMMLTQTK